MKKEEEMKVEAADIERKLKKRKKIKGSERLYDLDDNMLIFQQNPRVVNETSRVKQRNGKKNVRWLCGR